MPLVCRCLINICLVSQGISEKIKQDKFFPKTDHTGAEKMPQRSASPLSGDSHNNGPILCILPSELCIFWRRPMSCIWPEALNSLISGLFNTTIFLYGTTYFFNDADNY